MDDRQTEHREFIAEIVARLAPTKNRKLITDLITDAVGLATDHPDTLDLKIAASALSEMRDAYRMFRPYRDIPKVTIFGSARTKPDDPLYAQARDVAHHLAQAGWMVITGAGPGIMQAGMEGAGRDHSIGVSIRLPFEQGANPVIAGDEKYVSMKYFFTRKLMLIKESRGSICLPGGFGTLDETFELITLTQTGKGQPTPIVFLDVPGDPYWERVDAFVREQLVSRRLVEPADADLYLVTDSCERAVREVVGFYANYDSMRYIGDRLVLRVRQAPTDEQLAQLNTAFGDLCQRGSIDRAPASSVEVRENDRPELPRLSFIFANHRFGDLRNMIDTLNSWVTPVG